MRASRSTLWLGLAVALGLSACVGPGTVYVGVAGPGPWVGYPGAYPGVPYGRPMGYPPHYWDDDLEDDVQQEDGGDRAGPVEAEVKADREEAGAADPTA